MGSPSDEKRIRLKGGQKNGHLCTIFKYSLTYVLDFYVFNQICSKHMYLSIFLAIFSALLLLLTARSCKSGTRTSSLENNSIFTTNAPKNCYPHNKRSFLQR